MHACIHFVVIYIFCIKCFLLIIIIILISSFLALGSEVSTFKSGSGESTWKLSPDCFPLFLF